MNEHNTRRNPDALIRVAGAARRAELCEWEMKTIYDSGGVEGHALSHRGEVWGLLAHPCGAAVEPLNSQYRIWPAITSSHADKKPTRLAMI